MHQSEPYGHLKVGSKQVDAEMLARMVGARLLQVQRSLKELEHIGVFSRTQHGIIFSRRMVKDEANRRLKAQCGRLGGNPKLIDDKTSNGRTHEDKQMVNHEDNQPTNQTESGRANQNLTPSVSSSSSVSKVNGSCMEPTVPVGLAANGSTPYQVLVNLWNRTCGSLPQVRVLSDDRKASVRSRWHKNPDLSFWEQVFKRLAASEFAQHGTWATFDWVFKSEKNHLKVLEGNYDNKKLVPAGRNLKDEGWEE